MCFPTVALGFHLVALFEAVQQKLTNRWAVRDLSFAHLIARPSALVLFRFESKERIGRWHVNSYSSLQAKMKERKMREVIRFAWRSSSLGDFMVPEPFRNGH
jgi:hypothetical protein